MPIAHAFSSALNRLRTRRARSVAAALWVALTGGGALVALATVASDRAYVEARSVASLPAITVESARVAPSVRRNLFGVAPVVEVASHAPPSSDREVRPYQEMVVRAERSSRLIRVVSPFVLVDGVLRNGSRFQTVSVQGIDAGRHVSVAGLGPSIREGKLERLGGSSDGIVVGASLARSLGLLVGRHVRLVTPAGQLRTLTVVATFETGIPELDGRRCYVPLGLAQELNVMQPNAATGLAVEVSDRGRIDEVTRGLRAATGYRAVRREEQEAARLGLHRWGSIGGVALAVLLLISGALGVAIALLPTRAEAAAGRRFRRLALPLEGGLIGVAGGTTAVALGAALIALAGWHSLVPTIGPDGAVHPDAVPVDSIGMAGLALVIVLPLLGMMAGIPAAIRGARARREEPS